MQKQIKTTGDLRKFLADVALGVSDGTIDINKATTLVKVASQINQSFMTDVQVAKTHLLAKAPFPTGELYLGADDATPALEVDKDDTP